MRPAAAVAMQAHLEKLDAEGRLPEGSPPDNPSRWPSVASVFKSAGLFTAGFAALSAAAAAAGHALAALPAAACRRRRAG